jgi:hypothetical protein
MTAPPDTVKLSGTQWDKIQNTRGFEEPLSVRADIWRTATGQHVAETQESAGQRPFR